MTSPNEKSCGKVYLVGAGPGDPGLITRAGLERLRRADVVVYDALANPALLGEAPAGAERIDVGKRSRQHKLTQDQTNELLVSLAQQGKCVVRLKGGDPYLFGRGAEEAAHLARHGINCEVIPGITSGIAAPAAAGIPVTHRSIASTVTFVTGHEDPTKGQTAVDYAALARLISAGGTACFYMGVGRAAEISKALVEQALDPRTPAAAVQWGTLPQQRSVRSNVNNLAHDLQKSGVGSPAIIVVGQVAAIDEPGLDWFTRRPLFGQTVLVTRTRQQASVLRERLVELGAHVLEAPTIELAPPQNWNEVDDALRQVQQYNWLVLTSANGVDAIAQRLAHLDLDARHFAGVKLAAIGDATAAAMQSRLGLRPDLVPTRFVAESLAAELIAQHDMAGKRVLLLRADIARPALPTLLSDAGATVTEVVAYETRLAKALPDDVLAALRNGAVHWVTFTSASTANNLAELLRDERSLLNRLKIASIGPITSEAVRALGLQVNVEADVASIDGLVAALTDAAGQKGAT